MKGQALPRGLKSARAALIAYTGAFMAGTILSVRRGYKAEAIGLRTTFSPRTDALLGHGAALAAPWQMMALLWQADLAARRSDRRGRRARARLAVLGSLVLSGAVAEPVSHRLIARDLPLPDAVVATANIAIPIVILMGAAESLVDAEQSSSS